MDDCPMMEKYARAARERDELKREVKALYRELAEKAGKIYELDGKNRLLVKQKEMLLNRLVNMKLRGGVVPAKPRCEEKTTWIKPN